MRFRIAVLLALLLGVFSSPAFAQLEYNVKGGIGFATMSFDNDGLSEFYDGSRTGLVIGGGVDIPAGNLIKIAIEALYNQKGASGSAPDDEETVKLDYIQIPILIKFPFTTSSNIQPFVYAGAAPSFAVSRKLEGTFFGEDFEDDLDEDVKSFDNAVVFGGGARFGQMALEARYDLGVQNISDDPDDGDAKTRQFSILFSYFFGMR